MKYRLQQTNKHHTKQLYSNEFAKKSSIYFGQQPTFDEILQRITQFINIL
jgi:hypothetical protein